MIPIPGLLSCDARVPVAELELSERVVVVGLHDSSAWEREAAVRVIVVVVGDGEGVVVGEGEWQLNELSRPVVMCQFVSCLPL